MEVELNVRQCWGVFIIVGAHDKSVILWSLCIFHWTLVWSTRSQDLKRQFKNKITLWSSAVLHYADKKDTLKKMCARSSRSPPPFNVVLPGMKIRFCKKIWKYVKCIVLTRRPGHVNILMVDRLIQYPWSSTWLRRGTTIMKLIPCNWLGKVSQVKCMRSSAR